TPTGADLMSGLWPVFVGPLAFRMIVLGGLGIVLTASVTSLLPRLDAAAALRLAWRSARHRPAQPGLMILRGLALVTAGCIVAFHPIETLQVLAVLNGGLLLF